jgi:transcriptional regulator with GAF, ATPase, and Fis domain
LSEREQLLEALRGLLARAESGAPDLAAALRALLDRETAPAAGPAGDADSWQGLIGTSPVMLELRERIRKFGPANAPVLITGESGTGKERVAQALYATSPRASRAFVAENCAAIPETLLESVLFGHKRGAFTGAVKDHPGHFVAADRGTLFLDEIGEMKLPMQVKLLRVLQEGEVRAVGDSKTRKVDVRVLAATNQNLEAAVAAGRFREDLYFRLNVLRLPVPPLRERGDDVLLLARRFLHKAGETAGRRLVLSPAAEAALLHAPWPGNGRPLQNEMPRIAALCDGPTVEPKDLSPDARGEKT